MFQMTAAPTDRNRTLFQKEQTLQTTTIVKRALMTGLAALSLTAGGNLLTTAPAAASGTAYAELWRVEFPSGSGQGQSYRAQCARDAIARGYTSNYVPTPDSPHPGLNRLICYGVSWTVPFPLPETATERSPSIHVYR